MLGWANYCLMVQMDWYWTAFSLSEYLLLDCPLHTAISSLVASTDATKAATEAIRTIGLVAPGAHIGVLTMCASTPGTLSRDFEHMVYYVVARFARGRVFGKESSTTPAIILEGYPSTTRCPAGT